MHVQSIEWQNEVEWKKEVSFSELYPIHAVWVATSLVFRRYSLSLSLSIRNVLPSAQFVV